MRPRLWLLPLLALLINCSASKEDASLAATSRRVFGTITPVKHAGDTPALVALGRQLYFATELSVNGTQSCNSCHPVDGNGPGVDNKATSAGAQGFRGKRNTPTVLNAALHATQFWDGRAATLEEQAAGPIINPLEMAMPNHDAVAERLRKMDPGPFRAAFPNDADPFTIDHAARAIAAFERTLHTTDRFDRFQAGDHAALTSQEKQGLRRFMELGCTSCHNGPLAGARIHQKIGIVNAWPDTHDLGRYEVTKSESDRHVFKVPALRNVALTRPYFHDGSVPTLPEAVERMAWHQLGMKIERKDRDAIVTFLEALSGSDRS